MRVVLIAALVCCVPQLAAAQSAVVLVPPAAVPGDALERARSGAIEVLAERGMRLVRAPDGPECDEDACATEMAHEAGAEMVALVFVEEGDGGHSEVRVRLVPADGDPREAVAMVGDAGFAAASGAALEDALERRNPRRSGFLMVRTQPPGARVEIDGDPAGESPLRRMVRAGEHRVRIGGGEGAPRERTVTVQPMEESAVEIDLGVPEDPDAAQVPRGPTRTEPSPFNWLISGGLAIGGVIALISPLQTLSTNGQCVDVIENVGCQARVQFGVQSGILLGLGIAALAGAVIVEAVAPLRVEIHVDPTQAMVGVEGRF